MFRISRSAWFCPAWLLLVAAASGEDPQPTPAAAGAPAEMRYIHRTNGQVIGFFDQIAKAAGAAGHKNVGAADRLDKPVRSRPPQTETALALLEKGAVDVWLTTAGNWVGDPEIEKWVKAGLAGNPDFRLYHQARFLVGDNLGLKNPADRDHVAIADLQAAHAKAVAMVERRVDAINKELSKQAVFIVPVGEAVNNLRALVVDGKYPGVTRQSELFRDFLHAKEHVNLLSAYCDYAAIYGKSPQGLKVEIDGFDDTQHEILQRLAWEAVSKYPRAGVAK